MSLKNEIISAINKFHMGDYIGAEKVLFKLLRREPKNPDINRILGEIFLTKKDYLKAILYFEKSLDSFKKQPTVINNCGLSYFQLGQYEKSISLFNLALKFHPKFHNALFNKGLALEKIRKLDEAFSVFKEIVELNPKDIIAYNKITSLLLELGNFNLALEYLDKIALLDSNFCDAIFFQERSLCYLNLNNLNLALNEINLSIEINPNLSESFNNRGNILKEMGRNDEAFFDYEKAIKLNPNSADAYNNLANLQRKIGKFDEAEFSYNEAIRLEPNNFNYYKNRSILFNEQKKFKEALEDINFLINKSEELDELYRIRAEIYTSCKDFDSAINDLNTAIAINPSKKLYFNNRGLLYQIQEKYEEAENDYRAGSQTDSQLSEIQKFNLSILYLTMGKFKLGWKYYPARKVRFDYNNPVLNSSKPLWKKGDTKGLLYVYNEQGIGDQIIFSSLLYDLKKDVKDFILSVDPRLVKIYERSFENIKIYPRNAHDTSEPFLNSKFYDCQISLSDLGGIYRNEFDDFKLQPKSFLKSDPEKKKLYEKEIHTKKNICCGVSWKSFSLTGQFKSINLVDLVPILKINNIEFVNLQYGKTNEEQDLIKDQYGINLYNQSDLDLYNDIDNLFALVDACDLIITTSSVTAHIAGSLGKRTYLILPMGPGEIWYWKEHQSKNLWYPSITILKQSNFFDINQLINNLKKTLEREYV